MNDSEKAGKPERPKKIEIFINKVKYELENPVQTGASLKELAGIPARDVLFLQEKGEDVVIVNEATVTLKNGAHLHSQPPADYGNVTDWAAELGLPCDRLVLTPQGGGWAFLQVQDFPLPEGYVPGQVRLLVKLPPLFPEAAPDMFWVNPAVRLAQGGVPRATSNETILGETWQRFSWHLAGGAWKPGESTLRDFLRCIRSRLFLRS